MKLSITLATTCVLLSAPALAQSPTTPHATGATQASPTISTQDFVNKAIERCSRGPDSRVEKRTRQLRAA
jgi:hypothetical protein